MRRIYIKSNLYISQYHHIITRCNNKICFQYPFEKELKRATIGKIIDNNNIVYSLNFYSFNKIKLFRRQDTFFIRLAPNFFSAAGMSWPVQRTPWLQPQSHNTK